MHVKKKKKPHIGTIKHTHTHINIYVHIIIYKCISISHFAGPFISGENTVMCYIIVVQFSGQT